MKPAMALLASFISGCVGSRAQPSTAPAEPSPPTGTRSVADPCAVARPHFGGAATDAGRGLRPERSALRLPLYLRLLLGALQMSHV